MPPLETGQDSGFQCLKRLIGIDFILARTFALNGCYLLLLGYLLYLLFQPIASRSEEESQQDELACTCTGQKIDKCTGQERTVNSLKPYKLCSFPEQANQRQMLDGAESGQVSLILRHILGDLVAAGCVMCGVVWVRTDRRHNQHLSHSSIVRIVTAQLKQLPT